MKRCIFMNREFTPVKLQFSEPYFDSFSSVDRNLKIYITRFISPLMLSNCNFRLHTGIFPTLQPIPAPRTLNPHVVQSCTSNVPNPCADRDPLCAISWKKNKMIHSKWWLTDKGWWLWSWLWSWYGYSLLGQFSLYISDRPRSFTVHHT